MTPEKARQQANNIMEMFWHNFLKSEPAFVMRDVIAIALENACNPTELSRQRPQAEGATHPTELLPSEEAAIKYGGRARAEDYCGQCGGPCLRRPRHGDAWA